MEDALRAVVFRGMHPSDVGSTEIAVEYKRLIVHAFERETGKWRAEIWRLNGPRLHFRPHKIRRFITGIDTNTASAAILMAMAAIDAGTFSPHRVHGKNIGVARTEH